MEAERATVQTKPVIVEFTTKEEAFEFVADKPTIVKISKDSMTPLNFTFLLNEYVQSGRYQTVRDNPLVPLLDLDKYYYIELEPYPQPAAPEPETAAETPSAKILEGPAVTKDPVLMRMIRKVRKFLKI